MPHLGRAVLQATADKSKNRVFAVAEVIGQVSGRPLAEYIAGACRERKGVEAVVERVELRHLPPPAAGERRERREEVVEDNGKTCFSFCSGCGLRWVLSGWEQSRLC